LSSGAVTTDKIALSAVTGAIMPFYRPTAPDGWLICDGSAIPTQYTALTALVGANTPNLQGQFIRGLTTNLSTTSKDPLSASRTLGSTQEDVFESHTHNIANGDSPINIALGSVSGTTSKTFQYTDTGTTPIIATGGTETRPVNVALLYCIKT
jgi:microcystin-dependent protein